MAKTPGETRDGVALSSLDSPAFDGAGVPKRAVVDYLDAVSGRIIPELEQRPLSVVRARPGQPPFMQKNLPKFAPDWIARTTVWAHASQRDVAYALCDDRRTLLWFANQRAIEYHPTLIRLGDDHASQIVLDLDPPEGAAFGAAVAAARLVREALAGIGLTAAVKTSGAKGLHVVVPLAGHVAFEDAAAATARVAAAASADPDTATTAFIKDDREGKVFVDPTRAGGATLVAAYSPRARPGVPVSFPVAWDDLDAVTPADFTVTTALAKLGDGDPWRDALPSPQALPAELVEEGHTIPVPRVQAMHEGKRRKRAAGG